MKKILSILLFISVLCFTSCVSTDQIDINGFVNRYNSVSEIPIKISDITTNRTDEYTIHNIFKKPDIVMSLKTNNSCEIVECSVTTSNQKVNQQFHNDCIYSLIAVTGCNKTNAEKAEATSYDKPAVINEYEISTKKDDNQTTIIIRQLTENQNINPTLKDFLK